MKGTLKICHKIQLRSEKETEVFRKRAENPIRGTPRISIDRFQNNLLTVWVEDLRGNCLSLLKDNFSTQRSLEWANNILEACLALIPMYGFFIINENMVFLNEDNQVQVWINPNILENKVKIYLPPTSQGETTMIRSIISFFKLWLKCDYNKLAQATRIHQLPARLQPSKLRSFELFKRGPQQIPAERRSSANNTEPRFRRRFDTTKFPPTKKMEDSQKTRFSKKRPLSPQESQPSNFSNINFSVKNKDRINNIPIFYRSDSEQDPTKTKKTQVSERQDIDQFEHRTFNNTINTTTHFNQTKTTITSSLGGLSSYFPNRTTSNRNHIVRMILEFDSDPNYFGKNNLLLDEDKLRELQKQKLKKLKESLHGIGEELNDLFQSGLFDSEDFATKDLSTEFQHLLE